VAGRWVVTGAEPLQSARRPRAISLSIRRSTGPRNRACWLASLGAPVNRISAGSTTSLRWPAATAGWCWWTWRLRIRPLRHRYCSGSWH